MPRTITPRLAALAAYATTAVIVGALLLSGCNRGTPEGRARQHLDRGLASLKSKQFRRAIIEFRVASQNSPRDPEPTYQLGLACLAARDGRCALEAFEKTLRLKASHEGALYQLAILQSAANQAPILDDAAQLLEKLLQDHPANSAARYALAMVQVKLGKPEEALRNFDLALTVPGPNLDDVRLAIGAAIRRGDQELAKKLVGRATTVLPQSAGLAVSSAAVAALAGQHGYAASEIARALSLEPKSGKVLQLRMVEELSSNKIDRAEATARELAALPDPASRSAHAVFLAAQGRKEEALSEFSALRSRFPDDESARRKYVEALLRFGEPARARTELDRDIRENGKQVDLLLMRVCLNLDESRAEDAAADIDSLDALEFHSAAFSLAKARLYLARGEKRRAGDQASEALRRDPRLLNARFLLSRLLVELGNPAAALGILEETTDRERAHPQFSLYRAVAEMASGDWAAARKSVNESLSHSRSVDVLVQDTALRMHNGDIQGAERTVQEVLAADPGNLTALGQSGALWQARKQFPAFLVWIEKSAGQNPGNAGLQLFAGHLLLEAGNTAAARLALERADAAGAKLQAGIGLAEIEIHEGKLNAAESRLLTSIRNRDSAQQRVLLADVFVRKSDWKSAEQNLRIAHGLAPADSQTSLRLAAVIANDPKRIGEATVYVEKALAISLGNPAVESAAGWLYYRTRHFPNAVTHLKAALVTADNSSTRYRLAAACVMAGDPDCATAQYDAAVKQNPDDPVRAVAATLLEKRIH